MNPTDFLFLLGVAVIVFGSLGAYARRRKPETDNKGGWYNPRTARWEVRK